MTRDKTITRPLVRYHGGKFRLAPWIINHFPRHKVYVEPFGGGGSVLLRKSRSQNEVYNDLSKEIVNLFQVARDSGEVLKRKLTLTPFSRVEFDLSYIPSSDKIEQARRTVVRCFMGFGSNAHNRKTGFRAASNKSNTSPPQDWQNYPDAFDFIIERLQGVVIENKPAKEVCFQQDTPNTLFYLDPPYLPKTRDKGKDYEFEMTRADHIDFLGWARCLEGMVLISGYDSDLYNDSLRGWKRRTKKTLADGARERVECLWMNPNLFKCDRQLGLNI